MAKKPYEELLGEWVKQRESTRRDKNLVAFLAVRKDVKAAVDAGYAVKTIWKQLHETKRVLYGYDSFLNHVNRYIRRTSTEPSVPAPEKNAAKAEDRKVTPGNKSEPRQPAKPPDAIPGFKFNSSPKKEDLL